MLIKRDSMCDIEYGSIEINYKPSIINFINWVFNMKVPNDAKKISYYFDLGNDVFNSDDIKYCRELYISRKKKFTPTSIRNGVNLSVHNKVYSSPKKKREDISSLRIFNDHPSFPIIKPCNYNCAYRIYDFSFEGNVNYTLGLACIYKSAKIERFIFAYNKKEFSKKQALYLLDNILHQKNQIKN